jgi:hypothetical protein
MPFEILYCPLMSFGCFSRGECTEITPLSSFWIFLARIQPEFTGLKLADHSDLRQAWMLDFVSE